MTGDKVTGKRFCKREDGVYLYRFAVPNEKDEDGEWLPPTKKIRQEPTGILYNEAIDVAGGKYQYYETDEEIIYPDERKTGGDDNAD